MKTRRFVAGVLVVGGLFILIGMVNPAAHQPPAWLFAPSQFFQSNQVTPNVSEWQQSAPARVPIGQLS